jgi:hypothetical protein
MFKPFFKNREQNFLLIYGLIIIILFINVFFLYKIDNLDKKLSKPILKNNNAEVENQDFKKIEELIEEKDSWKEYTSNKYNWKIEYPSDWFINIENASKELEKVNISNKQFFTGGEVYWSNYKNFNEFEGGETPDDFKLLAFVIYKDEKRNVKEFAEYLGFIPDLHPYILEIESKDQKGKLYILEKEENQLENNINANKTAAIFKKDDFYYVFHIGLTAEEKEKEENILQIKQIISTFEII